MTAWIFAPETLDELCAAMDAASGQDVPASLRASTPWREGCFGGTPQRFSAEEVDLPPVDGLFAAALEAARVSLAAVVTPACAADDDPVALESVAAAEAAYPESFYVAQAAARLHGAREQWALAAGAWLRAGRSAPEAELGARCRLEAARLYAVRLGDYDQACGILEAALPQMGAALADALLLARDCVFEASAEVARRLMAACAALSSGEEKARWLTLVAEELGVCAAAAETLGEALTWAPQSSSALVAAELLAYQRADVSAQLGCGAHLAQQQDFPRLAVLVGRHYVLAGDLGGAEALLREALQRMGYVPGLGPLCPFVALWELLAETGRSEEELALLRWFLRQESTGLAGRALGRVADLLTHLGRTDEAIEAWQEAITWDCWDAYAYLRLGALLAGARRFPALVDLRQAEAELVEVVDPLRAALLRRDAAQLLAFRMGSVREALALLRPEDGDPLTLCTRACLLAAADDKQALVALLDAAAEGGAAAHAAWCRAFASLLREGLDAEGARDAWFALLQASAPGLDCAALFVRAVHRCPSHARHMAQVAMESVLAALDDPAAQSVLLHDLGRVLEGGGELEAARDAYGWAVSLAPQQRASLHAWERMSLHLGCSDEVQATWLERLRSESSHVERGVWSERLMALGTQVPSTALDPWLAELPTNVLWWWLRRAWDEGRWDALPLAWQHLRERLPAAEAGALGLLLQILAVAGGMDLPAWEGLWPLSELQPQNPLVLALIQAHFLRDPHPESGARALGACARGAVTDDEQVVYLSALGRLLAEHGQHDRSRLALEEVLRLYPQHVPSLRMLRLVAWEGGEASRLADALEAEAGVASVSKGVALLLQAAEVRRRQMGDIDGAVRVLRQALAMDPKNLDVFRAVQDILRTHERLRDLYAVLLTRAGGLEDVEERRRLLLKAGELAYDRLHDDALAIQAHMAVIALDPSFVRSYRVIAEIHIEKQRWKEALRALEGVLKVCDDRRLRVRTLFQMGEILALKMGEFAAAVRVLTDLCAVEPEHVEALSVWAEALLQLGQERDAVAVLQRWAQAERVPQRRKEVLLHIAKIAREGLNDWACAEEAVVAAREVDPLDLAVTEDFLGALAAQPERRLAFIERSIKEFAALFHANVSRPGPLHAMYKMAQHLGDQDRRFTLASVLSFVGAAEEEEQHFYQHTLRQMGRRLPSRTLTAEASQGVLSQRLHGAFLHLLRLSDESTGRALRHLVGPKGSGAKRSRVSTGARPEMAFLSAIAKAYGMELPPVYLVAEREEMLKLSAGDEPVFVVDARDFEPLLLPETMARVAHGCAGMSMGVPFYAGATEGVFQAAVVGVLRACLPQRTFTLAVDEAVSDAVARGTSRRSCDALLPIAMEVADCISKDFLLLQQQALIASTLRLGIVSLFDPRPGLTVVARDGDAGHYDVVAVMKDMLLFLTGERYGAMRRELGVAVT